MNLLKQWLDETETLMRNPNPTYNLNWTKQWPLAPNLPQVFFSILSTGQ
jgi:hypothetical protein